MGWTATWLFARILRWGLWIGFLGFMVYVHLNRAALLTKLNQLPIGIEVTIYALAAAAIAAGFLELAAREKAGFQRPPFLGWPKRVDQPS
jgi:hypothetical protein